MTREQHVAVYSGAIYSCRRLPAPWEVGEGGSSPPLTISSRLVFLSFSQPYPGHRAEGLFVL